MIDGVEKARFALAQACAAAALADALPDPFAKRLMARGVFVATAAFIEISRPTRNQIAKATGRSKELAPLRSELNALADRDWGPYRPLRDRIGAHRQPIGPTEDADAWAGANALFAEIDRPLVGVLCDDMRVIFDQLAAAAGSRPFTSPDLSDDVSAALTAAFAHPPAAGVSIATGSFGETVANTTTPIQGTAIGERLRQVSDAIDGWEMYATASTAVSTSRWLHRAVAAGAIIETANAIELIFDVPQGRAQSHRFAPLVELLPDAYVEAADLKVEHAQLPMTEVAWVRDRRNSVAAHIDLSTPLVELLKRLDATDPRRLSVLFHQVVNALSRIDAKYPVTVFSPFVRLRGATLAGTRRIDPPEHSPVYDT